MKDITIFDRMTSLETLDITGHPEFLMSEAEVEEEESKLKEGSPEE
jgi:hypothetical protein